LDILQVYLITPYDPQSTMSIRRVAQVMLSRNPQPGFCDEPTRFEMLAFEVGMRPDELRGLLCRLIGERAGWRTPRTRITCSICGSDYELSTRRAREAIDSGNPRCRLCMQDSTPGPSEIKWLTELPAEVRERAVAAMSALAA
jgi:hypothetical protein